MNIQQHRRDLLGVGRVWLIIMFIFFMINFLAIRLFVNNDFLLWFNSTCMFGTMGFIIYLDIMKDKIIKNGF